MLHLRFTTRFQFRRLTGFPNLFHHDQLQYQFLIYHDRLKFFLALMKKTKMMKWNGQQNIDVLIYQERSVENTEFGTFTKNTDVPTVILSYSNKNSP